MKRFLMSSTTTLVTPKPTARSLRLHRRARLDHPFYLQFGIHKFPVPDDKVLWNIQFSDYKPVEFTHPRILEQPACKTKKFLIVNQKSHQPYICGYIKLYFYFIDADPIDPKTIDWSKKR